jgi:GNAT superfamily N-acetyltransferase
MDDATLLARAHAGLVAQTRLLATHGGTLIEDDGWLACVIPHAPTASIVNCVVGVPDVERAHAAYTGAGVQKWGVWLDSKDCVGAQRLEDAGLVLDSAPVVMGAALDDLQLDSAPDTQPVDLGTVGAVNDLAYGHDDHRMERVIAAIPRDAVDPHSIHDDGEPAAVTFILDVEDDACVGWVATLSSARRRGLATGVLTGALRHAKQRGRTSTTLWASAMGTPVYARLGYREVGRFHLWERRP